MGKVEIYDRKDEVDESERFCVVATIADMNYEGLGSTRKSAYMALYRDIEIGALSYFKKGLKETERAMNHALTRAKNGRR